MNATCDTELVPGSVLRFWLIPASLTLTWPAVAAANTAVLGSSLSAPASISEAHKTDTAFWPLAIASGAPFAAPADGQVLSIRLKGTVPPPTAPGASPVNEVHFQTLDPQPDGTLKIALTSGPFDVPIGGDPNQISEYRPENLCIKKGQIVAFNVEGGVDPTFYPDGTPFQVFGSVPSSSTAWFEQVGATSNGDTVRGTTLDGTELLMQYTLGSATDAAAACGGTTAPGPGTSPGMGTTKPSPKMTVAFQRVFVSTKRSLSPGVRCPGAASRCKGTATLTVKRKAVASASFSIPGGHTVHIQMKLSKKAYAMLRKAPGRKLAAVLAVKSQLGSASHSVLLRQ